ncbi:hypothetical protein PAXINDRAFT_151863 [Paxillus involutus ATCC 200175]|nr:hypothetical protein PAXINDRAFT_151863 [Paxillus involutus ATCC 200175]
MSIGLAVKLAIPVDNINGKADDFSAKYPSPPPDKIELAKLCAIMHISNHNFWFTADAGYQKPISVWHKLAAVKPSCTMEEPDMQPPLGNGELESYQGYEPEDSDGSTDAAEEAPGGSTEDNNNELAIFSIENWLMASDAAQAKLEVMKGTHRVIPIPAYNVEGKLISLMPTATAWRVPLLNSISTWHTGPLQQKMAHW